MLRVRRHVDGVDFGRSTPLRRTVPPRIPLMSENPDWDQSKRGTAAPPRLLRTERNPSGSQEYRAPLQLAWHLRWKYQLTSHPRARMAEREAQPLARQVGHRPRPDSSAGPSDHHWAQRSNRSRPPSGRQEDPNSDPMGQSKSMPVAVVRSWSLPRSRRRRDRAAARRPRYEPDPWPAQWRLPIPRSSWCAIHPPALAN